LPRLAAVIAAAALIAAAAISVALGAPTSGPTATPQITPTPSNPFPSPSPEPSPSPTINGYAAALIDAASGSGGSYVPAGSTPPAVAFPSTGGSGFTLDVTGKFSQMFAASLRLQDDSLHGGDRPFSTTTEGAILYDRNGSRGGVGVSYISMQRSNGVSSATGGGFGGAYLPDTTRHVSVYGKIFYYPSLSFPQIGASTLMSGPTRASLVTFQVGLAIAPSGGGGLFYTFGIGGHAGGPSAYSPQSVTALQLGLGTTF
jgi:hypothetical protein